MMRFWVVLLLGSCATQKTTPPPPKPSVAPDAEKVPFGPDERAGELAFLRDALRETYSHLDTKKQQWGVDLDERFAHYEPLIRKADNWDRYERVMVAFVSEFHDAHLAWRRKRGAAEKKRRIVRLGLETQFVGDQLIVSEVWPDSGADRAGLRAGDRIVGMDGDTLEESLGRLSQVRSWSRIEDAHFDFAEEWPAQRADMDAPPPDRRVTREKPDGAYETLLVAPETKPRPEKKKADITFERKGTVALVTVRSLAGRTSSMENQMSDAAREIFHDPKGLVIDLRGNNGGFDVGARIVTSRLVAQPVVGAQMRVRLSKRARERGEWKDLPEDPATPGWSAGQPVRSEAKAETAYPARMAVLIDAGCRSSCEALALLLRAAGARLFGERTGGSSGAPVPVTLPKSGARVTVPAWAMFDLSGNPIEGRGVIPDEEVAPTRADVAAHKDPVLERALSWAGKTTS
jgi:C-terminal processing protease CtpA/Prc